jgi:hypothetical protein
MGHDPVEITIGILGYIKVGHGNAHRNSLLALEGNWNQRADTLE